MSHGFYFTAYFKKNENHTLNTFYFMMDLNPIWSEFSLRYLVLSEKDKVILTRKDISSWCMVLSDLRLAPLKHIPKKLKFTKKELVDDQKHLVSFFESIISDEDFDFLEISYPY